MLTSSGSAGSSLLCCSSKQSFCFCKMSERRADRKSDTKQHHDTHNPNSSSDPSVGNTNLLSAVVLLHVKLRSHLILLSLTIPVFRAQLCFCPVLMDRTAVELFNNIHGTSGLPGHTGEEFRGLRFSGIYQPSAVLDHVFGPNIKCEPEAEQQQKTW